MLLWLPLLSLATPRSPVDAVTWLPVEGAVATVRLADGVPLDAATRRALGADARSPGERLGPTALRVLQAHPDLHDPRRIWHVATSALPDLRAQGRISQVWAGPVLAPPPGDLAPPTPDFTGLAAWRQPPPVGLGGRAALDWPGGDGAGVRVADVEYDLDLEHEDLSGAAPWTADGSPLGDYRYHGNAALGLVGAADDGFGTTGVAPAAELVVFHPVFADRYDPAAAILAALEVLEPGDVLLLEQQAQTALGLGPISARPEVFDAVALATAAGLVVVEPAGNGAVDLDDPRLADWFAPDHDSGSIVVGGLDATGTSWNGSSSFGRRIDVSAPGAGLPAPSSDDGPTDLFFPGGDPRQAYMAGFGGTSGASALVAGACASAQGVSLRLHGEPIPPDRLRTWIRAAGRPQPREASAEPLLGRPLDLRRLLRAWLTP